MPSRNDYASHTWISNENITNVEVLSTTSLDKINNPDKNLEKDLSLAKDGILPQPILQKTHEHVTTSRAASISLRKHHQHVFANLNNFLRNPNDSCVPMALTFDQTLNGYRELRNLSNHAGVVNFLHHGINFDEGFIRNGIADILQLLNNAGLEANPEIKVIFKSIKDDTDYPNAVLIRVVATLPSISTKATGDNVARTIADNKPVITDTVFTVLPDNGDKVKLRVTDHTTHLSPEAMMLLPEINEWAKQNIQEKFKSLNIRNLKDFSADSDDKALRDSCLLELEQNAQTARQAFTQSFNPIWLNAFVDQLLDIYVSLNSGLLASTSSAPSIDAVTEYLKAKDANAEQSEKAMQFTAEAVDGDKIKDIKSDKQLKAFIIYFCREIADIIHQDKQLSKIATILRNLKDQLKTNSENFNSLIHILDEAVGYQTISSTNLTQLSTTVSTIETAKAVSNILATQEQAHRFADTIVMAQALKGDSDLCSKANDAINNAIKSIKADREKTATQALMHIEKVEAKILEAIKQKHNNLTSVEKISDFINFIGTIQAKGFPTKLCQALREYAFDHAAKLFSGEPNEELAKLLQRFNSLPAAQYLSALAKPAAELAPGPLQKYLPDERTESFKVLFNHYQTIASNLIQLLDKLEGEAAQAAFDEALVYFNKAIKLINQAVTSDNLFTFTPEGESLTISILPESQAELYTQDLCDNLLQPILTAQNHPNISVNAAALIDVLRNNLELKIFQQNTNIADAISTAIESKHNNCSNKQSATMILIAVQYALLHPKTAAVTLKVQFEKLSEGINDYPEICQETDIQNILNDAREAILKVKSLHNDSDKLDAQLLYLKLLHQTGQTDSFFKLCAAIFHQQKNNKERAKVIEVAKDALRGTDAFGALSGMQTTLESYPKASVPSFLSLHTLLTRIQNGDTNLVITEQQVTAFFPKHPEWSAELLADYLVSIANDHQSAVLFISELNRIAGLCSQRDDKNVIFRKVATIYNNGTRAINQNTNLAKLWVNLAQAPGNLHLQMLINQLYRTGNLSGALIQEMSTVTGIDDLPDQNIEVAVGDFSVSDITPNYCAMIEMSNSDAATVENEEYKTETDREAKRAIYERNFLLNHKLACQFLDIDKGQEACNRLVEMIEHAQAAGDVDLLPFAVTDMQVLCNIYKALAKDYMLGKPHHHDVDCIQIDDINNIPTPDASQANSLTRKPRYQLISTLLHLAENDDDFDRYLNEAISPLKYCKQADIIFLQKLHDLHHPVITRSNEEGSSFQVSPINNSLNDYNQLTRIQKQAVLEQIILIAINPYLENKLRQTAIKSLQQKTLYPEALQFIATNGWKRFKLDNPADSLLRILADYQEAMRAENAKELIVPSVITRLMNFQTLILDNLDNTFGSNKLFPLFEEKVAELSSANDILSWLGELITTPPEDNQVIAYQARQIRSAYIKQLLSTESCTDGLVADIVRPTAQAFSKVKQLKSTHDQLINERHEIVNRITERQINHYLDHTGKSINNENRASIKKAILQFVEDDTLLAIFKTYALTDQGGNVILEDGSEHKLQSTFEQRKESLRAKIEEKLSNKTSTAYKHSVNFFVNLRKEVQAHYLQTHEKLSNIKSRLVTAQGTLAREYPVLVEAMEQVDPDSSNEMLAPIRDTIADTSITMAYFHIIENPVVSRETVLAKRGHFLKMQNHNNPLLEWPMNLDRLFEIALFEDCGLVNRRAACDIALKYVTLPDTGIPNVDVKLIELGQLLFTKLGELTFSLSQIATKQATTIQHEIELPAKTVVKKAFRGLRKGTSKLLRTAGLKKQKQADRWSPMVAAAQDNSHLLKNSSQYTDELEHILRCFNLRILFSKPGSNIKLHMFTAKKLIEQLEYLVDSLHSLEDAYEAQLSSLRGEVATSKNKKPDVAKMELRVESLKLQKKKIQNLIKIDGDGEDNYNGPLMIQLRSHHEALVEIYAIQEKLDTLNATGSRNDHHKRQLESEKSELLGTLENNSKDLKGNLAYMIQHQSIFVGADATATWKKAPSADDNKGAAQHRQRSASASTDGNPVRRMPSNVHNAPPSMFGSSVSASTGRATIGGEVPAPSLDTGTAARTFLSEAAEKPEEKKDGEKEAPKQKITWAQKKAMRNGGK